MTQIITVAKSTKNVLTATDPNDFLFHSSYNTFKIIVTGTREITLLGSTNNQNFTQAHGLSFVPLVTAYAKESGYSQVFAQNSENIWLWGPKAGYFTTGAKFNYITSDSTNIIFNFDNSSSEKTIDIRYYCLESI